jgi:hypothetical protein
LSVISSGQCRPPVTPWRQRSWRAPARWKAIIFVGHIARINFRTVMVSDADAAGSPVWHDASLAAF